MNEGTWTKEELNYKRDTVFRDAGNTAKWIRTIDQKETAIQKLREALFGFIGCSADDLDLMATNINLLPGDAGDKASALAAIQALKDTK